MLLNFNINVVLAIAAIIVFGYLGNGLFKLSYNLIFFASKKPFIWMTFISIFTMVFWGICAVLGWNVSIPAYTSTIVWFMNASSYKNKGGNKLEQETADDIYRQIGLKRGRLLYKIGLGFYVLSSLLSWILFYSVPIPLN